MPLLAYYAIHIILHLFGILQMLSPLIVVLLLCPGANAAQKETPFPDITC